MKPFPWINAGAVLAVVLAIGLIAVKYVQSQRPAELLNVSYDPTRELYQELNQRYSANQLRDSGRILTIKQSHGGSSHQAREVIAGTLPADVVTLGLPSDVEALHKRGLLADGWADRLPNHSRPYYSTIVFVVRKGNPLAIQDWPDLIRPGIEVITPDPKTSGNGKLTALAAWGSVVTRGGSDAEAQAYLKALYDHAPFLVPAAREAGVAFAVERLGDVHLAWENEALREVDEAKGALQIVYPPVSLRAEPTVAWVDQNVTLHDTTTQARAYLEYLFSDEAQEILAHQGYRPYKPEILARHIQRFPAITLFPITGFAKDWNDAQQRFFGENGIIDSVYKPKPR